MGNKLHKIGEWLHHKGYLKKGLKRLVHIAPSLVKAITRKIPGLAAFSDEIVDGVEKAVQKYEERNATGQQ